MSRVLALLLASWALSNGRAVADEHADLEALLRSEHAWVRALAAEKLSQKSSMRAHAALARALDDPAPFVRHQAAYAFARWQKPSPQVTEILNASLQSKDWYVRWQACLGLKLLGENAKAAVPRLLHTLCDTELDVCREAALALGNIAPKDERVVLGLAKTLNADHPVDASAILYSLEKAGEAARFAVPLLVEASRAHAGVYVVLKAVASEAQKDLVNLADPDPDQRRYAIDRMARQLEECEAVRYLRLALDDPDRGVRGAALKNLGGLGDPATVALPAIIRALRDPDVYARSEAWGALARLAPRIAGDVGRNTEGTMLRRIAGDAVEKDKGWTLNLKPGPWQEDLRRLVDDDSIGVAILDALAEVGDKSKEEIVAAMRAAAPPEER